MTSQWQPEYQPRRADGQPATPPPWQQQPPPPGYGQPQYPPQPQYQPPGYGPQFPPPGPPRRQPGKSRKGLFAGLGCGGLAVLVILIAVIAGSSSSSSSAPAAGAQQTQAAVAPVQSTAPAKPAAAQTVTYVVTGSAADVTYGGAGSNASGSVPMHVTKPLGTPVYYAITAQLQGGGSVSCKIEVDGKAISSSTASGGYNIASCEISQDPLSGAWTDTNG